MQCLGVSLPRDASKSAIRTGLFLLFGSHIARYLPLGETSGLFGY